MHLGDRIAFALADILAGRRVGNTRRLNSLLLEIVVDNIVSPLRSGETRQSEMTDEDRIRSALAVLRIFCGVLPP